MACWSGSLLRDQPQKLRLSRTKGQTDCPLTEYLLFTRPLDRRKLLRKLFLQILRYRALLVWIVMAVFITGAIGDTRRLWPELRGELEKRWR